MKIAVIYENGTVFQHFGHCHSVKLYTFDEGTIIDMKVVELNGDGHGSVADFMSQNGVETVICGGIGAPAAKMLTDKGIELCAGVSGEADKVVMDYLMGRLNCTSASTCSDHDHHDHGGECGAHCGGHCSL